MRVEGACDACPHTHGCDAGLDLRFYIAPQALPSNLHVFVDPIQNLSLPGVHALTLALARAPALAPARARAPAPALAPARARARARARALDLDLDKKIFEAAVRLLDQAMLIGKKAEPLETAQVETRMAVIKQLAEHR